MKAPFCRTLFHALVVACLAAGSHASGQENPAGATIPSDPRFTALRIDGTTASGRLRQFAAATGAVVETGPGQDQTIPLDRLVRLTREGVLAASNREGGQVLFPDGDRLTRSVIGGIATTNLDVQSLSLGGLAIPAESLLGLIFNPPAERDLAERILGQVRNEPRKSEMLWIANGDRLSGSLIALDEKKVAFQPSTGKVELDRSGVVALGFDPSLVTYRRPEGIYVELSLLDGSRLGVTGASVDRGQVVAMTRFGVEIHLPLAELAAVTILGGPVAYLSDREATGAQYEPYLGPTRPYRRNLNVNGQPIRLGGQTYERGLGTQSRTLLAYRLEPGVKRFQATVGTDDLAGSLGSVAFKVLLDGTEKVLFASPSMSARETPRSIDVDISGGRLLILITEFGDRGDVQDLANWAEARIVR